MNVEQIRKLIDLMNENELQELEYEEQGVKVRLKKMGEQVVATPLPATATALMAAAGNPQAALPDTLSPAEGPVERDENLAPIDSPLVGTFYRAPRPDADPYVEVGDTVKADSIVCIIEAMKVMNEIRAEAEGTVEDILVQNGEPVEYGQPLFLIRKAAG